MNERIRLNWGKRGRKEERYREKITDIKSESKYFKIESKEGRK